MKDSVNLIAKGNGATIVGQGNAPTIDLHAASSLAPCMIKGFTLTRSGAGGSNARAIIGDSNGAVIRDCVIVNHSANEGAGALLIASSRISFEGCLFADTRSDQTPPALRGASAVTVRGTTAGSYPNIFYFLPEIEFTDCDFRDNETFSPSAGTVAIEYPSSTPDAAEKRPRFERCKFYRNINYGETSCISVKHCDRLELIECEFTDNDAGSVIDLYDAGIYVENCTIAANGHNLGYLENGTSPIFFENVGTKVFEIRQSILLTTDRQRSNVLAVISHRTE
jgi:hypothetical protein